MGDAKSPVGPGLNNGISYQITIDVRFSVTPPLPRVGRSDVHYGWALNIYVSIYLFLNFYKPVFHIYKLISYENLC